MVKSSIRCILSCRTLRSAVYVCQRDNTVCVHVAPPASSPADHMLLNFPLTSLTASPVCSLIDVTRLTWPQAGLPRQTPRLRLPLIGKNIVNVPPWSGNTVFLLVTVRSLVWSYHELFKDRKCFQVKLQTFTANTQRFFRICLADIFWIKEQQQWFCKTTKNINSLTGKQACFVFQHNIHVY